MSALAALAIVVAMAWMLVSGLRAKWRADDAAALVSVDLAPPRPTPRATPTPPRKPSRASAPKDAAGPPNLRNKATQVVALPVPPLIPPPPVVTAPQAGTGSAPSNGAADRPGPGQGAGGVGVGLGGGGNGGDGDGGGDGGGAVVGPRQIRGRLSFSDLPEGLLPEGVEGAVGVQYRVNVDGRVSDCRAARSSGFVALDALACRLIEKRFVFRPARNRAGRPVAAIVVETHAWVVEADAERRPR